MAVLAAFLGVAMAVEIYYFPERLRAYLALCGVESLLCLGAFALTRRWREHARSIATGWAAVIALCVCSYYPLVKGDATLAMAALICLISAIPATLPLGPWHQIVFGSVGALGFFTIVACGTPMSLPWPYMFVAYLCVLSLSSLGAYTHHRFRSEAFQREAVLHDAHDQLRTALAQAEGAVEMRDRLVANVSHELRTPINVIIGYSDMLCDASEDAAAIATQVGPRIRDYAVSLEALVSELLDLSRLSCGKVKLSFTNIDVPMLLEEVARGARSLLGNKPVEVVIDCDVTRFYSDRMRLRQILNNLAANAAKFTEAGKIVLTARAQRDWVGFYVSDTGCGIPAAKHETIFSAFEQLTPGTTGSRGIGLGLAIVRQLADLLGGNVSVTSAPGVGSSFAVMLPDPTETYGWDETRLDPRRKQVAVEAAISRLESPVAAVA